MARRVNLTGKPICITGASSGIGAATAIACAEAGMPVFLSARREDRLQEVARRVREHGGQAETFAADVIDRDASRQMIQAAEGAFGPLYAVFANAGYGVERAIHEMSDADFRDIFEVNLFGSLNAVLPAIPGMVERGAGHVVFCSSCLARFPLPYFGAYSATKASQHHVGRAMRLELAPYGVHVSTVHPVGTKTEFFDVTRERSKVSALIDHSSERFMQTPEVVARSIVRCLRRPRAEVWTSLPVRLGMIASALTPGLSDRAVRRMVRQRMERDGQNDAA